VVFSIALAKAFHSNDSLQKQWLVRGLLMVVAMATIAAILIRFH
jgi:hypothetical protein